MPRKIYVSMPPGMPGDQKNKISDFINNLLQPILPEVTGWNGFIDLVETNNGQYNLFAKCDNDEVRQKMEILLESEYAL